MLVGAAAVHAVSPLVSESFSTTRGTPGALVALAYLALAASALGFPIFFDLPGRLGPVDINLVSSVVPVFAAAVGWVVLGEVVEVRTAGGFVLIWRASRRSSGGSSPGKSSGCAERGNRERFTVRPGRGRAVG